MHIPDKCFDRVYRRIQGCTCFVYIYVFITFLTFLLVEVLGRSQLSARGGGGAALHSQVNIFWALTRGHAPPSPPLFYRAFRSSYGSAFPLLVDFHRCIPTRGFGPGFAYFLRWVTWGKATIMLISATTKTGTYHW